MSKLIKRFSLFLFVFPCCTFALELNSYFQQGFSIDNHTQYPIIASDANQSYILLQNTVVQSGYVATVDYDLDRFTNQPSQTFGHTVTIYSQNDNKLICTIKSNIIISLTSLEQTAKSSDESKCSMVAVTTYNMANAKILFIPYYKYEVTVTA